MFIVAKHTIHDPEKFWQAVQDSMPRIPDSAKPHAVLPNKDGNEAVCLWESDSIDTVKNYIESEAGDVSTNEFYEVESSKALGLPG